MSSYIVEVSCSPSKPFIMDLHSCVHLRRWLCVDFLFFCKWLGWNAYSNLPCRHLQIPSGLVMKIYIPITLTWIEDLVIGTFCLGIPSSYLDLASNGCIHFQKYWGLPSSCEGGYLQRLTVWSYDLRLQHYSGRPLYSNLYTRSPFPSCWGNVIDFVSISTSFVMILILGPKSLQCRQLLPSLRMR